jgi:hypothetical protein
MCVRDMQCCERHVDMRRGCRQREQQHIYLRRKELSKAATRTHTQRERELRVYLREGTLEVGHKGVAKVVARHFQREGRPERQVLYVGCCVRKRTWDNMT